MQQALLKKISFIVIILLSFFGRQAQAQTDIAVWDFDASDLLPSTGTGTASSPLGAGSFFGGNPSSGKGWSLNSWFTNLPIDNSVVNDGKYIEFSTSTVGYENIKFLFDLQRSGTGPTDFEVKYSTDGTTFSSLSPAFIGSTPSSFSGFSVDLSAVGAVDNAATVYFRIYGYNAASGTGNIRIDNVKIQGNVIGAATIESIIGFNFDDINVTADSGLPANTARTISREATTTFSFPAGASGQSASSNNWDNGNGIKYYVINFTTTDYENITVESKQRSSNTGPRDFKVQYSIDNTTTWADVPSSSITIGDNFTTGILPTTALPTIANDQATVYLRWIMTSNISANNGTIGTTGTSRIDDIIIKGTLATPKTLFFSEYVEGSSNNKALEIYNPTGADVDLLAGVYTIEKYNNGASTPNDILSLTGTLAAGATYVIANPGATFKSASYVNLNTGSITFFNGDDAIVLKKNGVVIDGIGQVGFNPGSSGWTVGTGSTTNFTLRRGCAVTSGDTDETDTYAPTDWVVFPQDTFSGLGSHCPTSVINVMGTPLTAFTTTAIGVPSSEQTYTLTASNLTTDLVITAPTDFEIAVFAGGTFTSTFGTSPATVPFALANATTTTVQVRYNPSIGTSHTGNVSNESSGATTVNVAISGTVPPSLITIATARTRPVDELVIVEGILTVSNQLGGPAFIQDATGGIAVFDNQIHGGTYPIGQKLRISAKRVDFQNQIQLSTVTSITDLGAVTPIEPEVITLDQLEANRGKLVKINAVTFPDPNEFLFGNANYTVTNGANSGDVRIDADTDLSGRTQPTTCDVIGVVAYFQTAAQLIPRFQSDLPCTTPYVSSTSSTVTACIALPKTLEVSTFNIEWFGDEANSPAGINADVVQKNAVKTIIKANNADIYTLVEIVDIPLMEQLATELSAETADSWKVLFSNFVSTGGANPQKVGFLYKTNIIQPIFSYALLQSVHPKYNGGDNSALVGYPDADRSRFWASGRLPFWMRASVTLNGSSEEVDFIVIHARANNAGEPQERYDMRRYDVTVLEDSIRANSMLAGRKIIMGGDYNDDVDFTVANIASTTTSFDAFTTRPADYTTVTEVLSLANRRSYVSFENMIDHIMVSNELAASYIPNSASVGYEYFDANYTRAVSDHFIVSARFEIVPIAPCTFTATPNSISQITLNWTDNSNIETTYIVEQSLNGTTGWTAIAGSPFAVNSTTRLVTGLNENTNYFFRVRAEESATNFSQWKVASAKTLAVPLIGGGNGGTTTSTIISPPTNFKATGISSSQVNLTWDAVNGATGYILYRGNVVIATLGNITSFEDKEVMGDTFYSYRIVARNASGSSNVVQSVIRTLPDSPTVLSLINACSGSGGIIKVSSTGTIYRIYSDSVSTTPLFETNEATITTLSITETTTFYLSVISNENESERTAIIVNVNPLPIATILEDTVITCSSTGTITAQEVMGASYEWLLNGNPIATTTTNNYEVIRSGNYQVRVVLNGCSTTSDIIPVRINFIPLAEIIQGQVARSCESSTTISAKDAGANASYEWRKNDEIVGNTASISVLESGTYTLVVTQNGCSATNQIEVEVSTINSVVSFSASQLTFCPDEKVTFRVDEPQQNVTYRWVQNGRVLRNITGTEYVTSIVGEYKVEASQNNCTVVSAPIVITRTRIEPVYLRVVENVLSVESITPITEIVWLLDGKENVALTGQMSFTPTVSGYYSAHVVFETGCRSSTIRTVYYTVPDPIVTGEDNIISVETIVYPNPSKTGVFKIQLSTSITSEVTFTITSTIGRVLESKVIKANEISTLQTLDFSKYAKGMYTLTINTEQGTVTKKIIIE